TGCRPREGGDPYAVSLIVRRARVDFEGNSARSRKLRQGLWVPAFAGTTWEIGFSVIDYFAGTLSVDTSPVTRVQSSKSFSTKLLRLRMHSSHDGIVCGETTCGSITFRNSSSLRPR